MQEHNGTPHMGSVGMSSQKKATGKMGQKGCRLEVQSMCAASHRTAQGM
jgi:hypothetical protein